MNLESCIRMAEAVALVSMLTIVGMILIAPEPVLAAPGDCESGASASDLDNDPGRVSDCETSLETRDTHNDDEQDAPVITVELEYDYTIEVPEGWTQEQGEGEYSSDSSPWARLKVRSQRLPEGYDVDQFSQFVQDYLREDIFPSPVLFEITSVEEDLIDNHPAKLISYRVQEAPQYCVLDVEEVVLVSRTLPGNPYGFRIRLFMCEPEATGYGKTREDIFNGFQVTTRPAQYYTKYLPVMGVMIKSHESVDPAALEAGAEIVGLMLSKGRPDIIRCLPLQGADLAIIPRDKPATDLPEFAYLAGTTDFTGRRRDTFEIRGLGGVRGQPVSSAGEEQILGNWGSQHPWYPYRGLVAAHEYAHAVQNLCFTQDDHKQWNEFYEQALEADLYPGSHMMTIVDEFFAAFSTAYFEVTDQLGRDPNREELRERFPKIILALDGIYGGSTLPEKYRVRQPHPSYRGPDLTVSSVNTETPMVRVHAAIPVMARFSEPVNDFTTSDVTLTNGDISNFLGRYGNTVFTFDVTPNAIGVVTVDIAAGVAQDSYGNGNTAAAQLTLGLPYDDDGDGAINSTEVLMAVADYFSDKLTSQQVLAVVALYFQSSG